MQQHSEILTSLDAEFNKMDALFSQGDIRVFGRDTDRIFKELDIIRRKQIALACDHIAIETVGDLPPSGGQSDIGYQASVESFNKKEAALKNLMLKLDDLGSSMNRFREISDPDMQFTTEFLAKSHNP